MSEDKRSGEMKTVSIEKCNSYNQKELNIALIKSLKNLNFKFKKNQKILIKPNVLGYYEPEKAITTNPLILEELCKILKKYNSKIYIGDSSGSNTEKSLEVSGINKLSKYGKILNFDKESVKTFAIQDKKINLPKIIFEVDLIINFAKMKTHTFTGVTLCSKNLYGCIPGEIKSYIHRTNQTHEKLSEILISLNKIIKPRLNFIDGIDGIEGNGPGIAGKKIHPALIIASENTFATDIIASELMGFNADDIETNRLSGIKKRDIRVIGENNVRINFEKPSSYARPIFRTINNLFPKPRITFDKELCEKCHICEKHCPVKTITLETKDGFPICEQENFAPQNYSGWYKKKNSKLFIPHKNCILCFCCIEMCLHKAVLLKDHWTKRSLKYLTKLPKRIVKMVKR